MKERFETKEVNKEANGGDPFSGDKNAELMKYSEYSREHGSDGFSKSGGKGNGF